MLNAKFFCTMAGGFTIILGLIHFFFPVIMGWLKIVKGGFPEFRRGIMSINFFFSFTMVLVGTYTIILIWVEQKSRATQIWLAIMCILYLTRTIFQAIYPQGALVKKRWIPLTVLAGYTTVMILFIVAFVMVLVQ